MPKPIMPAPTVRTDGMLNVLSGLGTQKDVAARTTYHPDPILDRHTLEAIFAGDGLGRKIVEKPAEESVRRWFEIEGDDGETVEGILETTKAQAALTEAYTWARLYGGAGIIRLVNDGGDLADPLRPEAIRGVIGYRVHDRHDLTWTTADLEVDPMSPQYGQPAVYTVNPSQGMPYRVHHTRLSIIDGARLPRQMRDRNNGWGASALQGAWQYLMRVGSNYGYTSNIMRDFVQSVLAINGLTELLAGGQDQLVRDRINMLDVSKSILNGMIIDADGESYSKSASSVAGIADLMDRHAEGLCAAADIPMMELFGRSPSGMNATGAGETRSWYGRLEAERNARVGHVVEDMVRDTYHAAGGEPAEWSIKWRSLYTPTDEEQATTDKTEAETAQIYWNMGAVDADEVRQGLRVTGRWELDEASQPVMPPPTDPTDTADA